MTFPTIDRPKYPLYRVLASLIQARENCERTGNAEWFVRHADTALDLVKAHMPSGSGFDNGTQLDLDQSTAQRLVFSTAFHHMDGNGSYCGWTEHTVTVKADLASDINISISGRDRNQIKDYMHEVFHSALTIIVER